MLLIFYIDESYNNHTFNLGGWLGSECEWSRLESQWDRRIELERRRHGKFDRFHATHCNRKCGNYKGWSDRDKIAHTKALLGIVTRRKMAAVCAGLDVDAMLRVYPDENRDWMAGAYRLTVGQLMIMVSRSIKKNADHRVAIIHDWAGKYNPVIQDAFARMQDNASWKHQDLFTTCKPMKWQHQTALQAADMIAFDTFKLLDGTIHSSARMRKSLQAILDKNNNPVRARYIGEPALLKLREVSLASRNLA